MLLFYGRYGNNRQVLDLGFRDVIGGLGGPGAGGRGEVSVIMVSVVITESRRRLARSRLRDHPRLHDRGKLPPLSGLSRDSSGTGRAGVSGRCSRGARAGAAGVVSVVGVAGVARGRVAGGWLAAREAGRAAAGRLAGRWIRASIWKTGYGFSRLGRADLMGVVYGVPEQL